MHSGNVPYTNLHNQRLRCLSLLSWLRVTNRFACWWHPYPRPSLPSRFQGECLPLQIPLILKGASHPACQGDRLALFASSQVPDDGRAIGLAYEQKGQALDRRFQEYQDREFSLTPSERRPIRMLKERWPLLRAILAPCQSATATNRS